MTVDSVVEDRAYFNNETINKFRIDYSGSQKNKTIHTSNSHP